MTKYQQYYSKAVSLIKAGNHYPGLTDVAGEYPTNQEYKIASNAIFDAHQKELELYSKAHPRHLQALRNGADAQECLRIWKEEGGSSYLDELN